MVGEFQTTGPMQAIGERPGFMKVLVGFLLANVPPLG
jgi:hypothetical protein